MMFGEFVRMLYFLTIVTDGVIGDKSRLPNYINYVKELKIYALTHTSLARQHYNFVFFLWLWL
jgi:hypothetical protein